MNSIVSAKIKYAPSESISPHYDMVREGWDTHAPGLDPSFLQSAAAKPSQVGQPEADSRQQASLPNESWTIVLTLFSQAKYNMYVCILKK